MWQYIKSVSFSLALMIFGSSVSYANVLDGAREYNGHYYKVFSNYMKWGDAKYYCESMGGHLATPETRDENNFIKSLVMSTKGSPDVFWIGGEKDTLGFFRWMTTNKIILYSDWSMRTPNLSGNNKAIKMCSNRYAKGKWIDRSEMSAYGFICEWDSAEQAHESNW